jgi:hypothetical protein
VIVLLVYSVRVFPLGSGVGGKGRFGVGLTVACDDVPCGGIERDGQQRDVQRRRGSVYDG